MPNDPNTTLFDRFKEKLDNNIILSVVGGLVTAVFTLVSIIGAIWINNIEEKIEKTICELVTVNLNQGIERFTEQVLLKTTGLIRPVDPVFAFAKNVVNQARSVKKNAKVLRVI